MAASTAKGVSAIGPPFLQNSDLDSVLESDAFESAVRIVLIVLAAMVLVWVLQRALTPIVRVAIREQMAGEAEIEVQKRIETLSHVIYRTLLFIVLAVVIVTILPEFGVNAAALIAGLGLFGLAVGFGAQNLVKDIINGTFILVENQYGVGDVVTIADITGVVQDINLRRTILRDQDGVVHSVGHGQVDITSNWTKSFSRVNLNVAVTYDTNIDTAIAVIDRVGKELAEDPEFKGKVIDPPHVLRVDSFTDSGIELKIVGDTAPIEQWTVMGELRLRLKKAFDAEGIEIPYILRPMPAGVSAAAAAAAQSAPGPPADSGPSDA